MIPCWCHVRSLRCVNWKLEASAAAFVPVSVESVSVELYFFPRVVGLLSPSRMPYAVLYLLLPVKAAKV